jgi:hypothetical protein
VSRENPEEIVRKIITQNLTKNYCRAGGGGELVM